MSRDLLSFGLVVVLSGGNVLVGGFFLISLGLLCGRLFGIAFGFAFLWSGSVRHLILVLSGGNVWGRGSGLVVALPPMEGSATSSSQVLLSSKGIDLLLISQKLMSETNEETYPGVPAGVGPF